MKKHFCSVTCVAILLSVVFISWKPETLVKKASPAKPVTAKELLENYIDNIYASAHLQESGLGFEIFKKAVTGFINLKNNKELPGGSSVVTVIDFNKPSHQKRMWIVDLINKGLILNTWVAHGEGSGNDVANRFSDRNDSHKSSLGFYVTDGIYYGKHGRSLRLDGMDAGFNKNARKREIVVHGADYVGQDIIETKGRLGRSFGCPAVSTEVADQVIDAIKDKTVIFISGNNKKYKSKFLTESNAASFLSGGQGGNYLAGQ
jgi:hypothetical protein